MFTFGGRCELDWATVEGEGEGEGEGEAISGVGELDEEAYREDGALAVEVITDLGVTYTHSGGVTLYRS